MDLGKGPAASRAGRPRRRAKGWNPFFLAALLALGFGAVACAPAAPSRPAVTVTPERVPAQGRVELRGTGFTPGRNVTSHLRRPDGSEFPPLPILTDRRGEFRHEIETLLFGAGVYEVWVVDDSTGASSNVARFEATTDQPRLR